MPKRIFISYARPDRDVAEAIAQTLKSLEYDVWWDHGLLPAENFRAEITRNLEAADFVFVLWSPASISSQWVLDEAERGARKGRLIPLALAGFSPDSVPIGLNQQQLIFCADAAVARSEQFKRQVVEAITVLGLGVRSSPPSDNQGFVKGSKRLLPILAMACLVMAVGFGAAVSLSKDYLSCDGSESMFVLPNMNVIGGSEKSSATMKLGGGRHPSITEAMGEGPLASLVEVCEDSPSNCQAIKKGDLLSIEAESKGDFLHLSYTAQIGLGDGRYKATQIGKFASGREGTTITRESGTCVVRKRL